MERKHGVIAAAIVAGLVLAAASLAILETRTTEKRDSIGVFDVVVDREHRAWADIVFDHPVFTARPGAVLDPPPATVNPETPGVWRWRSENVLRFEPQGGFNIGWDYTIALKTPRFIAAGERFRGDGKLTVKIDKLMVEKVVTNEEPTGDRKTVVLHGEITFNYMVDPAMLVTQAVLIDGDERQHIEIVDSQYNSATIAFRTRPIVKREAERVVKLVIPKGLPETYRGTRLDEEYSSEIKIGSSEHLAVRAVEPQSNAGDSALRIELSSPVNPEVAAKFVTVTPPAKYHVSVQGNDVFLTGGFSPGTRVKLAIAKGLPGVDDAVLDQPYESTVTFPDLQPSLDFQSEGMFLSASGYKTLAIDSVNVPDATLAIDRVYRNNVFFLMANDYWYPYYRYDQEGDEEADEGTENVQQVSHTLGDPIARKKLTLRNLKNRKNVTTVSLEPYVKAHEPGLYRVVLAGAGREEKTRWILITDLGIVAKRGDDDLLVWVSSFSDLSAIGDAAVTLLSDQNQVLGSGRTDARGVWQFHDLAKVTKAKKQPFMLQVQKGNDFSFLIFGKTEVDLSPFDVAGDTVGKDGYSAFVYGERDIYRPGETVQGVAVVRTSALEAPPHMPLILKHFDAGQERESQRVTVGDGGVASFKLDLPAYARTGHHRFDVIAGKDVIGTYNFQVEEFVPDRIKVEIKTKPPAAQSVAPAGAQSVVFNVVSAYLFGPPAANLAVDARVRLVPSTFAPKGFEQFTFTDAERKFDAREIASESDKLDAGGSKAFTVALPPNLQPPSALEAVIAARVQESGGRGVAAVARVPVHPWPYYIGLRRSGDTFEWVAVNTEGKEIASNALRAEFYEDEWHSVLRRTTHGTYEYESTRDTRLLSAQAIPAGKSRGTVKFTPREYRTYRVVVSDPQSGAASQIDYYAGGWGYSPWAMKNPGRLQLELDKSEYAPNDTAVLTVKSPFGGKLLVTLERDDVYYSAVETLAGNSTKIDVPLQAVARPNAYITATVVRAAKDLERGEAGRAFGAIPINVDRESNRLHPTIKAPAELRSNHALPVEVTTEPGAVVTIAAVDEGILQLIAQRTPDPHAYFYRKLALGVSTNDIFTELLPEVKPRGKANAGGGENLEGLAQYVRGDSIRRAKPVAFWSGAIVADAKGRARAKFEVPDFQGGVRVMAVVHHGRHFGSADATTRVHDPLVLMPTFPRFLNVHDQVSVPVTVRNDTGRAGSFVILSEAKDLSRAGDPSPSARLRMTASIPNGSEKTVYFPLTAPPQAGEVVLDITVSGNGETAKASQSVGVRWDLPLESVESTGRFNESSAVFRNNALQQFVPGTVERTLAISPLPIVQFRGKLAYLLHYPYGCVEQTTSSVFPLVYFGDIAQELDPDAFKKGDPAVLIAAGIRRLGTMQQHNGGFSMWPYGEGADPWGSVYATHFLVEAKRAGHEVQPAMLDAALAYVATDAKAKANYDTWELQRVAYALYVLARGGKPDLGTMDYIREHHLNQLSAESKALLAGAYAAAGNPRMIDSLLAGINDVEEVNRQTSANFSSTIRNRALLLMAMLDAAPDDPRIPQLVERLTRDLKDAWWSTQEASFVLLALGQLAHRQHVLAPYGGTVLVDGKPAGEFTSKTVLFRHIRGANIVVRMNGGYKPGAAYYSLETRGIRTAESFKPESNGIKVTRELLTRDGAAAGDIKQGDLLVSVITVESTNGSLNNVVLQSLIPSGMEVENPRLTSSETFTWITGEMSACTNVDIRDDQVLYFVELPSSGKLTYYTLLRAVMPGTYPQPPVFAEAMYARGNRAVGERGVVAIKTR
jgi:uncharacterized protein YfaS (alpha-2-macroglobulin family)